MNTFELISIGSIAATLIIPVIGLMIMIITRMNRMHIELLKEVHDVKLSVVDLEHKVSVLWRDLWARSNSPIALNKRGREILEESGFKRVVETSYTEILEHVRNTRPETAYEVQENLIQLVSAYQHAVAYKHTLQEDAFNSGASVEDILFVAALSLRDRVVADLGLRKPSLQVSRQTSSR